MTDLLKEIEVLAMVKKMQQTAQLMDRNVQNAIKKDIMKGSIKQDGDARRMKFSMTPGRRLQKPTISPPTE